MFLIRLHFTHQHVLGKHPATSEFYELRYEAAFLEQGYRMFYPKKGNLSLGNEGFGVKLGVNLWSLNGFKTKHRCYPFSRNNLMYLFTEYLFSSYLKFSVYFKGWTGNVHLSAKLEPHFLPLWGVSLLLTPSNLRQTLVVAKLDEI